MNSVYGDKGRVTGYTDYYKNTSTPAPEDNSNTSSIDATPNLMTAEEKRKAALKRRLKMLKKVGS